MFIPITTGVGVGRTALAAFDHALFAAGIANYNLVALSSVIPTGATVGCKQLDRNDDEWGYRLYVVIAERRVVEVGAEAWAGIGYVQDETGSGLFVEHHGSSEHQVQAQIHESLSSMVEYRSNDFGPIEMVTVGATCEDRPTCALVAAVYESAGWSA
jgi:arginine decarboxylase